jgi:hypothetical protein
MAKPRPLHPGGRGSAHEMSWQIVIQEVQNVGWSMNVVVLSQA